MSDGTTYDVRIYRSEVYKGVKVTTYRVRWKAGNREWRQGFRAAVRRALRKLSACAAVRNPCRHSRLPAFQRTR